MRTFLVVDVAVALLLLANCQAEGQDIPTLTAKDTAEVRRRLNAFDRDAATLDDVTKREGAMSALAVISYYQSHSNDVTVKMLLPISRCYASFKKGQEAAELAQRYLVTYSNDWRGWDVLAAARSMTESLEESLAAATNAIRLGSDRNLAVAGATALTLGRKDVVEGFIIPRILKLKEVKDDKERWVERLRFVTYYSLETTNKHYFVTALDGLKATDLNGDPAWVRYVCDGCDLFMTPETEKLCSDVKQLERRSPTKAK